MNKESMKKKKVLWIAAAAALCITLAMGTMVIFAQNYWEGQLDGTLQGADGDGGEALPWETTLYKENAPSEEIGKAVCEKYGLSYETVTLGDMRREMYDYEFALMALQDYPDSPLLGEHKGGFLDSLESSLDDVYAFNGSRAIIEALCTEAGLDPNAAKLKDLTAEQLMELQETCYQTSDHPKGDE